MPVIAITNQKGGVGKTTTAVNLASELARQGRRCLLIDADPQGNATSGVGVPRTGLPGTYEVLMNGTPLRNVVVATSEANLEVVPASKHLAGAEVELTTAEGRYVRLARALSGHHYDYVVIDCPPSLGFLALNALVAARYVIIPVQCEYYALEGLSSLFETLRKVKKSLNPDLDLLGVAITMFDKRVGLSQSVVNEVRRHFPEQTFQTLIPRNIRLAEAPSHGRPVGSYDRWSKGARAYRKLAEEVHDAVTARSWQRA